MLSLLLAQEPAQQTEPAQLEPVHSSITVVEKVAAETPASITVLETPRIEAIPGVNLDDKLRMVPGFSLFRRSSGIASHPTTQGISLRGIGSTGASRTLVLWDGIPINDPFGGWVYWTRVAPEELDRIEISRGASTSVFGDRAMGGAIALFSRPAERGRATASYEFGNRNTNTASLGLSQLWKTSGPSIGLSGNARAFTTNGYYIVPESYRGKVDHEAGVRFVAADTSLDLLGSKQRLFLKFDVLTEERQNGTQFQTNSTNLGNISGHYHYEGTSNGFSGLAYHTREEFHSFFSSIAANRNTETPTTYQRVPSEAVGGAGYWQHRGSWWHSLVGADFQRVEGSSIEHVYSTGGSRMGGGSLFQRGFFFQLDGKAGPVQVYLGARDHVTGSGRQFFSPSAGASAGHDWWRVRGSIYRSFRAPTLNELYRDFRAGNALTQANPNLKPENVFGLEGGFDLIGESNRASFTVFRNDLHDLITNVTLSVSPSQIVRQRQNAARASANGFEFEFHQRWRSWTADLAYLFSNSKSDTGLRTPQIPRHNGSGQFTWRRGGTVAAFGARTMGAQFEDDLNLFVLPGFLTAHVSLTQKLYKSLSVEAEFENIFDREYLVGYSTFPTIGPPRLWRAGLRYEGRLW